MRRRWHLGHSGATVGSIGWLSYGQDCLEGFLAEPRASARCSPQECRRATEQDQLELPGWPAAENRGPEQAQPGSDRDLYASSLVRAVAEAAVSEPRQSACSREQDRGDHEGSAKRSGEPQTQDHDSCLEGEQGEEREDQGSAQDDRGRSPVASR